MVMTKFVTEFILVKLQALITDFLVDSVTESVFTLNLRRSLFLVSFRLLLWIVMTESVTQSTFSKPSGHSCKHKNFTKNGSDKVCARVSF